jgi:uncharacterized protein YdhG (YjbR/CyaY superfamily)
MAMNINFKNIDEYISLQNNDDKQALETLRSIIKKAAPKAEEVISYGMPAFKQHSVLVYFANAKQHYGFYPTSKPIVHFAEELKKYKCTKGAIQFPKNEKLPVKLITSIVKFRMQEDNEKFKLKSIKK